MSEANTNILAFPSEKIIRTVPVVDNILEKMQSQGRKNVADAFTEDASQELLDIFAQGGLDIESEQFVKDFGFLVTFIEGLIYRSLEMNHPVHHIMDNYAVVMMEDKENDIN